MASLQDQGQPGPDGHHQRSKSSVLRSFMMHRRNNSQDDAPVAAVTYAAAAAAAAPKSHGGGPLEETSHNRQASPDKQKYSMMQGMTQGSRSPTKKKKTFTGELLTITTRFDTGEINNENNTLLSPPLSPTKRNKTRSTAAFVDLLSRPKSFRNIRAAAKDGDAEADDEERGRGRGRNRSDEKKRDKSRRNVKDARDAGGERPPDMSAQPQTTPIYAQFCSTSKALGKADLVTGSAQQSALTKDSAPAGRQWPSIKPRPKSFHPSSTTASNSSTSTTPGLGTMSPSGSSMDTKEINSHLEALLDRRNIPEHQRYKMRSLASSIKMELIRQDWAEERERSKRQQQQQQQQPPTSNRPASHGSSQSGNGSSATGTGPQSTNATSPTGDGSAGKASKSMHSRVKSLTLSKVGRGRSRDRSGNSDNTKRTKSPGAPLIKRAEGTLGRHLRSKSTDNFAKIGATGGGSSLDATGAGSGGPGGALAGFFKSKAPHHNSPADFVTYLRTVQAPEKVEVGKLHKLRLILRNETVDWIEDFIGQGGMEEVVGLLHRIMAVEWREEHEDALLHENLLCLKALCTTALALQYLHTIHASLFPALIHMIFDPEKKGPSEFTTRGIVTWVLFTYIQTAPVHERPERARTVLGYLRDPERQEDERPVSFVLDMRKERPYRVWCKEVVNVTKEVFWIFLHHLNVVSLPAGTGRERKPVATGAPTGDDFNLGARAQTGQTGQSETAYAPPPPPKHLDISSSYMLRHFPQERPPVPAAPYVGGVEWEATNYLASHLDLVNAIIACTPTAAERTHLRDQMRMSGWERCMGSSLRLCKEKFYGAVHDGLRVWVGAAYEDGWDVRDVRYGPPPPASASPERRSNSPSKKNVVGGPKADEAAPKLEIPKLDFILD